jgi:outer membrane protein assembly factor BamD (BamD/ComL family)
MGLMTLSPRVRQGLQSLALALLMAGITTAAVKIFGWKIWPRPPALAASADRPRPRSLKHDQRLVAVSAEPASVPTAAPSASVERPIVRRNLSASEMFAGAKLARARGDADEALRLSKQIEEFFPNSPEGIDSHVTLGMLYLARDQAELALQEFATFRRIGSPEMKAEAYFGQAQALRKLARYDDERTVLAELIVNYPRSVYVAAARARLSELASDAGVH